jgi:glutaredoxin
VSAVIVYSRPDCHLCEQALTRLRELQRELSFDLHEVDISGDATLERAYFERIPVITVDGSEVSDYIVNETLLRERLESSR